MSVAGFTVSVIPDERHSSLVVVLNHSGFHGCTAYLSVADAERMATELLGAVEAVKKLNAGEATK